MFTWIIVILVFSVLIIVHEAGHLFAAKKAGIKVEVFSVGMGKRLFGKKIGDTDYRISFIPLGGFCKMAGEDPYEAKGESYEFGAKPVGYRFWVIAAGSLTNYFFAFLLFSIIFMIGIPTLSNEVGQLLNGYPAQKAGVKVGDEIFSVNGVKVQYWDDIVNQIKKASFDTARLELGIKRENSILKLEVEPEISEVTNVFGQKISRSVIGVAPANKILDVSYNPAAAVYHGAKRLIVLTGMTYKGIWLMLTGGVPIKTSVSGPIGIARLIGEAAGMGIVPLLVITAHINMALAIFNLLPFPVLDGGHIIFLAFEKMKGRPISIKVQEIMSYAAIALLISFMLFVSWQDILKTPLFAGK
ncbi:MAG: RIP metalloprotease RseP [Candidatus Omnitrophota bacterium]